APGKSQRVSSPRQNENLRDPCNTRGERVARGVPKVVLVWTPLASKVIAPLMSVKFARLKRLYVSQRNWMLRFSPMWKFLNAARSVLKMAGRRMTFLGK